MRKIGYGLDLDFLNILYSPRVSCPGGSGLHSLWYLVSCTLFANGLN